MVSQDAEGVDTAWFDYPLPEALIAQTPVEQRDASRLLVLDRQQGKMDHHKFTDLLKYLNPGDLLVLNNSRVIPARLRAANCQTGGSFEILLLEEVQPNCWWTMLRPGRRARPGTEMVLLDAAGQATAIRATVEEVNEEGHRRLRFAGTANLLGECNDLGEVPLPPYIEREGRGQLARDWERYQTVYAQAPGSIAAPTAGLHFTPGLLEQVRARGVRTTFVTLHVGLGTFAPVKAATVAAHPMHEERFELSDATAQLIQETRMAGGRVVAVGTTTVRVLESVAHANSGELVAGAGRTKIFIYPPYKFYVVNALLTNFHLPRSTLLMLVSAFAAPGRLEGRDLVLRAYAEAVRERYRFFSYGDAMFLC
jgi:S-adenosylmethionine:tRNA ribosyltransferase-isomerase